MATKDENGPKDPLRGKGKIDLRVREVPPALKAQLKSEAALKGKTLNDYVLQILMDRCDRTKGEM